MKYNGFELFFARFCVGCALFALGDLGDGDNCVPLCLDTDSTANRVSAAAGALVDPRGDLNPETSLEVVY